MTEFDFLSVLVSIIFGLALTHVLSGQFRFVYHGKMTERHLLYTGWVFMVLVLNWWMLFTWHDFGPWSFDAFLLIVLWSLSFYILAIALYPPEEVAGTDVPVKYSGSTAVWSQPSCWTSSGPACAASCSSPGTTCLSPCTTPRWPSSRK